MQGLKGWTIYPDTKTVKMVFYDHKPEVLNYSSEIEFGLKEGLSYEECIFLLGDTELKKEIGKIKEAEKHNEFVRNLVSDLPEGFYEENGLVYMEGVPVSIPDCILKGIKEDKKWINFWKWTALIPYPKNRENFYNYVRANNMYITEEGNVVGFRKAWKYEKLYNFVIETYEKLKKDKKKTSILVDIDYYVVNTPGKNVYLLPELYKEFTLKGIPYLSDYNGKDGKTFYYLGWETRMDESEMDVSNNTCSSGFHWHSGRYDDNSYGDVRLALICNPANIGNAPTDGYQKIRSCAITPVNEIDSIEKYLGNIEDNLDVIEISEQVIDDTKNYLKDRAKYYQYKEGTPQYIKEIPCKSMADLFNITVAVNKDIVQQRYVDLREASVEDNGDEDSTFWSDEELDDFNDYQ